MKPVFPSEIHFEMAAFVEDYFSSLPSTDTILVVNSCARGTAVYESDLDFAILVKPATALSEIQNIETAWQQHLHSNPVFLRYKNLTQFSHLHLDIIDGKYEPGIIANGEPIDYFEVEIGNQICYAAPMGTEGNYFRELQKVWLPYYNEELRLERLKTAYNACEYNLCQIPVLVKRGLYFHAFDILYKALQQYFQVLFITNKTYPIAYNKWIKEQIVTWLNKPLLYPKLSPILSIANIESDEINLKATMLRDLLNNLAHT